MADTGVMVMVLSPSSALGGIVRVNRVESLPAAVMVPPAGPTVALDVRRLSRLTLTLTGFGSSGKVPAFFG